MSSIGQRRILLNISGVICLTTLLLPGAWSELVSKIGQAQQISDPKRAATIGHHDEWVDVSRIGPARGQRTKLAPLVAVVDPILAPVTAAGHKLELTPEQRMERMGHPNNPLTRPIGCSRRLGPTRTLNGE